MLSRWWYSVHRQQPEKKHRATANSLFKTTESQYKTKLAVDNNNNNGEKYTTIDDELTNECFGSKQVHKNRVMASVLCRTVGWSFSRSVERFLQSGIASWTEYFFPISQKCHIELGRLCRSLSRPLAMVKKREKIVRQFVVVLKISFVELHYVGVRSSSTGTVIVFVWFLF